MPGAGAAITGAPLTMAGAAAGVRGAMGVRGVTGAERHETVATLAAGVAGTPTKVCSDLRIREIDDDSRLPGVMPETAATYSIVD